MESYFDKQAKCLYNKAEEIINTYEDYSDRHELFPALSGIACR